MNRSKCFFAVSILLPALSLAFSVSAQQQGPIGPPPTSGSSPSVTSSAGAGTPPPSSAHSKINGFSESPITSEPPSQPVEQVIQKMAQHESEFKRERDNYTYTQTFMFQTLDADGAPDGEYRLTTEVSFTPEGKRYEHDTFAPVPSITRLQFTKQDLDDLRNIQPFVLTTEELPKYNVTYVGHQVIDDIGTYVLEVAPKKIEKDQRYFQGRVWVDDKDLQIVKSYGKAVPDIIKKNNENIFPHFETYRENISGPYWFPTYTHADDVLHFSAGGVHIRFTVKYANYKRFGATHKIGTPVEIKQ